MSLRTMKRPVGRCLVIVLFLWCFIQQTDGALLSQNKNVRMSSQYLDWESSRAIDGIWSTNAVGCECCAATNIMTDPWFEIDLQETYIIEQMRIRSQPAQDGFQDMTNMTVYLLPQEDVASAEKPLYRQNSSTFDLILQFQTPSPTRYITFVLTGASRLFTVCEIEVIGECNDGQFGDFCERCNCLNGACDKTTGICPPGGCTVGYNGEQCNQGCPNNTYGLNCSNTCGNCFNQSECNTADGACSSCEPGYRTPLCKDVCLPGFYGENCSSICGRCRDGRSCNPFTSNCENGCLPGYLGANCQTACGDGLYGENCALVCGPCKDNAPCDVTFGQCVNGCTAGRRGPMCDLGCVNGTYGESCNRACNCFNGSPCNTVTGACPDGCETGYVGISCNTSCSPGSYGDGCQLLCGQCQTGTTCDIQTGVCPSGCSSGYTGTFCNQALQTSGLSASAGGALGGAIAAVVVLVLIVVVVYFILRRRKSRQNEESGQNEQARPQNSNGSVQTTTPVPDVPPAPEIQRTAPFTGESTKKT